MNTKLRDITELGDIREKRKNAGLSQFDMAKSCGVSVTAYQRWEHGCTKMIRAEHYDRIVEALK